MANQELDADLERLLEQDVSDLARYNILQYLHDRPEEQGDVHFFSDRLGLRSLERTAEALEALSRCSLLTKIPEGANGESQYCLNPDPASRELVERLCSLKYSSSYGAIVERLAARSLHRVKQAQTVARGSRRNGDH